MKLNYKGNFASCSSTQLYIKKNSQRRDLNLLKGHLILIWKQAAGAAVSECFAICTNQLKKKCFNDFYILKLI